MISHHANRVNIKAVADDVAHNPMLADALFAGIVKELEGDIDKLRQFGLLVAAKADPMTLEFLEVLGETAKMISRK